MLQAKMTDVRKFELFDVPEPKITGDEQVLIRIGGCGVCGSDMHPWLGESIRATYDRVPGHEFSGVIEEIRSSCTDFKPGDKVMINPAVSCGKCKACTSGQGYNCEQCYVIGGEVPGAFCEKIVVPVSTVHKLPDDMDLEEATIIEPIAFAVHCTKGLSGNVVVIGLGTVGLSCAMILHHNGCNVIGIDINDNQLATAKELCCDYIINSKKEDPVARVCEIVGGTNVDYVVDAVFNEWSVGFNLEILKKGGSMLEIGVPLSKFPFNTIRMLCREVQMQTRYLYSNDDFKRALGYVVTRGIDFRPLITKTFPLEKIQQAFEFKADNPSLKVVIKVKS